MLSSTCNELYHGTVAHPMFLDRGLYAGPEARYNHNGLPAANPCAIYVFADPDPHSEKEMALDDLLFPQELMRRAGEYFKVHGSIPNDEWKDEVRKNPVVGQIHELMETIDKVGNPVEKASALAIRRMFGLYPTTATIVDRRVFPSVLTIRAAGLGDVRLVDDLTFRKGAYLLADTEGYTIAHIPRSSFSIVSLRAEEVREAMSYGKYGRFVVMHRKLCRRVYESA